MIRPLGGGDGLPTAAWLRPTPPKLGGIAVRQQLPVAAIQHVPYMSSFQFDLPPLRMIGRQSRVGTPA
jgi:hypothetical protein